TTMRSQTHLTSSSGQRLRVLALVVVGLLGLTGLFVLALEAELGSATFGLALAGGALVLCLHSLHRMVQALSPAALEAMVERDVGVVSANRRALREERRRLLR